MASPFEVNLDGDIEQPEVGLTEEAAEAWGFDPTKRDPDEVAEEVQEMAGRTARAKAVEEEVDEAAVVEAPPTHHNMEVDSPKELWDAFGHIKLYFHVDPALGADGVSAQVGACIDLWAELKEEYADEIAEQAEVANAISPAQIAFIKRLCDEADEDLPEGFEDLGKEEASQLIQELKGKAGDEAKPSRRSSRSSGRSSGRSSSRRSSKRSSGRSSGRRSSGGRSGGKLSDKQRNYIEQLCDEADEDVPEDLDDLTGKAASELIQELLGN